MQKKLLIKKEIYIVFGIIVTILLAWKITSTLTTKVTSSAWDGVISTSFSGGNGSVDNPYIIGSAGEYAYFKSLMESNDAIVYADKVYKINVSFDYNDYDISINNTVPFSGVIDGNYNYITNAKVTNAMFNEIDGGTIKNLELDSLEVEVTGEKGGAVAITSSDATYSFLIVESSTVIGQDNEDVTDISGFIVDDSGSTIDKVIVSPNFGNIDSDLVSSFITNSDTTVINSALVKDDGFDLIKNNDNTNIDNLSTFTTSGNLIIVDSTILDNYKTTDHELVVENGEFSLNIVVPANVGGGDEPEEPTYTYTETPGASFIPVHASGTDNNTVYVNDLEADYNYYMGLNYTTSTNGNIPTQVNKNLYSDSNLTKVEIIYDSVALGSNNATSHNAKVSYLSGEAQTKYVYYKYYAYNTSNNTLDIELIDNPFSGRPTDMAFNGWYSDNSNIEIYLDKTLYTYHAVITVDPSKDFQVVSLRSSWTNADMERTSSNNNNINTALSKLKSAGIHELYTRETTYLYHPNMDLYPQGIYLRITIPQRSSRVGYYDVNGNALSGTCTSRNGCTVYDRIDPDEFNITSTYYTLVNNRMTVTSIQYTTEELNTWYDSNYIDMNMANFYLLDHVNNGASRTGYYDASGNPLTTNCNTNGGCDVYHKILYNELHIYDRSNTYYYLTTRDTNIVYLDNSSIQASGWSSTNPFTLTSYYNNTDSRGNSYYSISTGYSGYYMKAVSDTRVEFIRLYTTINHSSSTISSTNGTTGGLIYGNSKNFKIGRGLTRNGSYVNANMILGTTNTSSESPKYRLIVESGFYNFLTTGGINGSPTLSSYDIVGTYGSDYDRVKNDNSKLDVYHALYGDRATIINYGNNNNDIHYTQIVKSGFFGSSSSSTGYASGIYVTSNSSGVTYSPMALIVEGGRIWGINGGPGPASGLGSRNGAYIFVKGGNINTVFGGGAYLTSYSSRVIQITDGTINNSVFGGSNGYMYGTGNATGTNARGILNGDTYIYIGGKAKIGVAGSNELYESEIGSVFGIGNGRNGYNDIGTADNSYIVIDGEANILNNVYAGGNNGAVGYDASGSVTSHIKVLNGTINGSVYGGGNNNGGGTTSVSITSTIDMIGGTIKGSIYGGSNEKGDIFGTTTVNMTGGIVENDIYGGGYGNQTGVRNSVLVNIENGKINGSVYGGSAFGNVIGRYNGTTGSGTVTVNIKGGTITKDVFGGGMGSTTYEPHAYGNVTVNVSGGSMSNVYGGHDQRGTITTTDTINITGGIIGNVFGGGNKSSVNTTNINMSAGIVNGSMYGGSNNSGNVNTSNIVISGTSKIGNVYGGNNLGGSFGISNVTLNNGEVVNSIYGGGNNVDSNSTNITLNAGKTRNVFGGGKSASILDSTNGTKIIQNGTTLNIIYGGSDASGTVTKTLITHNSGNTPIIYGGNNAGGSTANSTINYITGTSNEIYGGGNEAETGDTHVNIQNGTITSVFGGGNSAGADSSSVNIVNGTITNVYGGSNNSGTVDETTIGVAGGTITSVFGGGNLASVGDTNVILNGGTIGNVYGGGNMASADSTNIDMNTSTVNNNLYGGGNFGVVNGSTYVNIENGRIKGSAYAGGNGASAVVSGNTVIEIGGTSVIGTESETNLILSSVFGGGNAAATGTSESSSYSIVNIAGGTIYGNVYGGANTSVINGIAEIRIGKNAITSKTTYNTLNNTKTDIHINGTVFGGGEANAEGSEVFDYDAISVTQGIDILIDGSDYSTLDLNGAIFGSGDASRSAGYSYITIKNYGDFTNPHRNLSIQRTEVLTIDNSNILLIGQKDRTNEYSDVKFSLSRINDLKLVNNSTLFLEEGTNLLEKFESLDASGNKAAVTIDTDNKTISKTVDNRLYVLEGKIVNIALDQQVTDYGEVSGMTFFGMYKHGGSNTLNLGIYKKEIGFNSTLNLGDLPVKGSYVLGLHNTNHNIEVDGFYSNFQDGDDASTDCKVDYINPTPESSTYYMWIIGEAVIEYNIDIVASKYSTLGSLELAFLEFPNPNTSFQILGFDSAGLNQGISLKPVNEISKIAPTEQEANSNYALTMSSSNTGWLTNGTTTFLSQGSTYNGTSYYVGDNTNDVPSMLFQLYHAKNLTLDQDLGTVTIQMMAIEKKNALESETKRVVINVNLSTDLYTDINYEGAMTPGDKYSIFPSTATNITDKSKFSTYFALFITDDEYYQKKCTSGTCYRTITSTYALPENTKITMIDNNDGSPVYYYYVITQSDYQRAVNEITQDGETSYNLSLFKSMGTSGSGVNYNDAQMNNLYARNGLTEEEFIFIFDFKDTEIVGNQLNNSMSFELRSGNNTITSVLGIERDNLKYSLYDNVDTSLEIDGELDSNPLYVTKYGNMTLEIAPKTLKQGSINIYNTEYFDYKLGISIRVKNSDGNYIGGNALTGLYYLVDGVKYYPDINGVARIKVADKVGSVEELVQVNLENSLLPTGSYTFEVTAFGSIDGIYYSSMNLVHKDINSSIINSTYGLKVDLDDTSVVLKTGAENALKGKIYYTSLLTNPNIRIRMYRRDYNNVYDTTYTLVDFANYVSSPIEHTNNQKEYYITKAPSEEINLNLNLKTNLTTGTYRLDFALYDNNVEIGTVSRYIIIHKTE